MPGINSIFQIAYANGFIAIAGQMWFIIAMVGGFIIWKLYKKRRG